MPRFNSDILPDATGRDLGSPSEQFDAHIQDLTVYRTLTTSGATLTGTLHGDITGNAATATLAASATKAASRDKGFINVMTDYSTVVGDGTTDDGPAIQAIIDANPSKDIFFPTLFWATTGATPASYKSNQRLVLNGDGQTLFGPKRIKRLGGTKISFASGIGGISLPSTYNNQGVHNLFLEGGDAHTPATLSSREDYNSISAITNLATSGIELAGSSPSVSGCRISSFKGHGVEVYGASGGQPDYWRVSNCYIDFNRGFGVFVRGTDANVGYTDSLSLEGNSLGGIYDNSNYGNTYSMTHTSQNASTAPVAGSNKTISGIVVASNVATITTSTAHGWTVGQWITTVPTDGTFASTGRILSTPLTTTATYAFTKADSSTGAGGTAATSSGTQVLAYYNAAGIQTGPYSFPGASSGGRLLMTNYSEGNQSPSVYSPDTLTLNQQGVSLTSVTTGHHIYATSGPLLVFKGGHWVFQPLLVSDQLIVRSLDGLTNRFYVEETGNINSVGTKVNLGSGPSANSNAINMSNTWGIYAKTTGGSNSRGVYFHSDDTWYIGDSLRALHFQATAADFSGTLKIGASGTAISQTRVYSQTITAASTAAASAVEQTFTVTGLTTADKVTINPPALSNSCVPVCCRVTAADTLGITFMNPTAGSLTSTSGTYQIVAVRS